VRRNVELQVGALVLVAAVILTLGLLFLKEFKFAMATWQVQVHCPEAARINEGAPLLLRGVEVGHLSGIELRQDGVMLTVDIEEGVSLPEDSRFMVQQDFLGPTFMMVRPGLSETLLEDGAMLRGESSAGLADILESAGNLMARLDSVSLRLDGLLADRRLDGLVEDLGAGARDLRAMAASGRESLPGLLGELEALAGELRGFVDETRGPLGETLEGLPGTTARLDSLLADLEEASVGLKSAARQLETGQGTVGRLVQEDEIYLRLESTLDGLDSLLADIKADPQRYLTFELF